MSATQDNPPPSPLTPQARERMNGHVVADPDNFPSGIKALTDYVHGKRLLLGIYSALGNDSCSIDGVSGLPRGTVRNFGFGCDEDNLPGCAVATQMVCVVRPKSPLS